jgi:hypothetical protein
MSHDRMVVLPRFSLKSWGVIGAWELGQSQKRKRKEVLVGKSHNRTEERREVLAGQSQNRTEEKSSGRGWLEGQLGLFFEWGQVEGQKAFGV